MKTFGRWTIPLPRFVSLAFCAASLLQPAHAQDAYSQQLLQGVQTARFSFTETDDGVCKYRRFLESEAAPLVAELASLGLMPLSQKDIEGGRLPDISVLVATEARAVSTVAAASACSIFVKVEAFHSMSAAPRHKLEPMELRVLAYRTIWFGTVREEQVDDELQTTALHAIAKFAGTFLRANSGNK